MRSGQCEFRKQPEMYDKTSTGAQSCSPADCVLGHHQEGTDCFEGLSICPRLRELNQVNGHFQSSFNCPTDGRYRTPFGEKLDTAVFSMFARRGRIPIYGVTGRPSCSWWCRGLPNAGGSAQKPMDRTHNADHVLFDLLDRVLRHLSWYCYG